jgi:hypothetical protein
VQPPAPDYTIHVSNASTLGLTIIVNGTAVGKLAPDSMGDYPPGVLPARPWTVEARMDGGRVIASMTVEEGAIQDDRALDGTGSYRSVGTRVTLSCGQVWLWVGEPGSGGPAAEGTPGDCDP